MLHVSIEEFIALKDSVESLRDILSTLDQIGAGIAAIHVDAAIHQLESNIEVVAGQSFLAEVNSQSCPSEHPVRSR